VALHITHISLADFRNYERFELEPDEDLTVIVGPNAVGKTNAIEAIELVTAAASFRSPQWADCVRWGADRARVSLSASGDDRVLETVLDISVAGRRSYTVNGSVKRRLADVVGKLPSVVFTPDDLRMVKDSADRRRSAIDEVGDQLSSSYAAARASYERVVRQRNTSLKEAAVSSEEIEAWTEQLIELGEAFSGHRRRLFERLREPLVAAYQELSDGEELQAGYLSSWERDAAARRDSETTSLRTALESARSAELARGTTLHGPHRDDIAFTLDGRDARTYASQGQQRSIALAWKLAEVSVIAEIAGQPPVLLLDDVMSELDASRRHALTSLVGASAQSFVTTTNLGYFDEELIGRAKVVTLT